MGNVEWVDNEQGTTYGWQTERTDSNGHLWWLRQQLATRLRAFACVNGGGRRSMFGVGCPPFDNSPPQPTTQNTTLLSIFFFFFFCFFFLIRTDMNSIGIAIAIARTWRGARLTRHVKTYERNAERGGVAEMNDTSERHTHGHPLTSTNTQTLAPIPTHGQGHTNTPTNTNIHSLARTNEIKSQKLEARKTHGSCSNSQKRPRTNPSSTCSENPIHCPKKIHIITLNYFNFYRVRATFQFHFICVYFC